MDLLGTRQVDPVPQSPWTRAYGFFAKGTVPTSLLFTPLDSLLFLTVFVGCLPRPILVADCSVAWFSPPFWYCSAVRLLTEHRSPFRFRLWARLLRCHPETPSVLLRSRLVLPYRVVRKHLGAVGE